MIDITENISNDATRLFRVKIENTENPNTRKNMTKAVDSLQRFSTDSPVQIDDINEDFLHEWVAWLFSNGHTYKTVVQYINMLSSLYGKIVHDGLTEDNGGFSRIKEQLKCASPGSLEINSISDCFGRLRRLVLADYSTNPARCLAKDMVLFSLYNGGLTFDEIARYRKDEYQGSDENVMEIVTRYSKPKNKYLFPLHQSERTPNQLNKAITSLFSDILRSVSINLSSYDSVTCIDLWAAVAIRCGISASDVASSLDGVSHVNPVLSFTKVQELEPERKTEIRQRVSKMLAKDPVGWYAMQFRPYVSYDQLQTRLKSAGISLPATFYPMEEIVRRVGKKMTRESRPVVQGLMFFKSKASELPALFYQIGDLAWGYRMSRNPRSPYAVIQPGAIKEYQRAIGQFADGISEYPDGTLHIEEGDKVMITDGEFCGHPAILEKEIRELSEDGKQITRLYYRLKLAGFNNFTWCVDLDFRRVVKISDEKFEVLKEQLPSCPGI